MMPYPAKTGAYFCAQGRACSSSKASSKSSFSPPMGAANWAPMGSPLSFHDSGTDMAGVPTTLWSGV